MKRFCLYITALILCYDLCLSEELTFEQCLTLAKEQNLRIKSAEELVNAANYEYSSAKGLFFPQISLTGNAVYSTADGSLGTDEMNIPVVDATGNLTGTFTHVPPIGIDYSLGWIYGAGVKIEQPIYMGGKITAGYKIAKTAKELYAQNRRLTEADIIVQTANAYSSLLKATEMREVALSYKTLLTELHGDVTKAYNRGMKPKNDVLKVQVQLNEAILNLRKAENACRLASMNLCHYIGRNLTDSITVSYNTLPQSESAAYSNDFSSRPEMMILDYKSEIARQKINVARADYLPQVGIMGQYGYMNGIEFGGKRLFDSWSLTVGLQVTIPIFDFGYKMGKIKAAKAQLASVEAEREDTNRLLALGLSQAINNLDEAYLELELANFTVAAADENLRSSAKQYQAGMESLSDNLEAQTIWQQAHMTLIDAKTNLFLKNIEYLRACGKLN